MSWEVIIPFLRPIEPLIRDPDISDILVNGASRRLYRRTWPSCRKFRASR